MDTGDPAVGDRAAAVERDAEVGSDLTGEAERRGFLGDDVGQLRIAQQRLGGDATHVEAHPAPVLGLDDGGVQAELRAADGRDITAGAGTEDDDVIVGHGLTLTGAARRKGRVS